MPPQWALLAYPNELVSYEPHKLIWRNGQRTTEFLCMTTEKKNIRNNKWLASAHASTRIHRNKLHDRKFYRYSLWHQHTRSKYKKYIYSYAIFLLSSVVFSIHWRVFCSLPQSAIELHSHWLGCVVRRGICVKRICVCMYCGHGHVCLCHRQND